MKLSRKMIMGLVVLVCFVVVVSGCTSSNNQTSNQSSNTSSSNTTNASASNDVNIVVNYAGSWAVDVSGNFGYRSLGGSGDKTNSIGSVSGPVTAAARKTDGGTGVLIVSITKGGQTLATTSTSAPYGGATAFATV